MDFAPPYLRLILGYVGDMKELTSSVHPLPRPDWTRIMTELWVEDRSKNLWAHCSTCKEKKKLGSDISELQEKKGRRARKESKSAFSVADQRKLDKLIAQMDKVEYHVRAKVLQNESYHKEVEEMIEQEPQKGMVVMDFSKFSIGGSSAGEQVLIFVLLHANGKSTRHKSSSRHGLHRKYFDFLAHTEEDSESNDFFFFRAALHEFLEQCVKPLGIASLSFWSDGGRKHFKQRFSLAEFSFIRVDHPWLKCAVWNFFASNHGKCLCDSHAGKIAQQVVYCALNDGFFWLTAKDLAGLIKSKCSNSFPVLLNSIDRSPALKHDVSKIITDLYKYHSFKATTKGAQLRVAAFTSTKTSDYSKIQLYQENTRRETQFTRSRASARAANTSGKKRKRSSS
jgi:hypothetical protein